MENSTIQQPEQSLRILALKKALSYEGQEEIPRLSNAGPFVEACLKMVGLGKGHAWCMAFVYRCYEEAAKELGIPNPCPKTAGVLNCLNKTPNSRVITKAQATPDNIIPGYQFIMDFGKGLGHTGIVVQVNMNGTYIAIEGNTDEKGGREGNGVHKRLRRLDDKLLRAFIVY